MLHPVIELLVIAEVEPLLLERPLQVPVSLGHETELRVRELDRGDEGGPVVLGRLAPALGPQVRSKTSLIMSMAMSQRTPSHCSAISETVAIGRLPQPRVKALS